MGRAIMSKLSGCKACLFAGMEPVKEWDVHGPMRWTCAVWGKPRRPRCGGWTEDRREGPPPSRVEIEEARIRGANR